MKISWEREHKGGSNVKIWVSGAIVGEFKSLCTSLRVQQP